MKKFIYSSFVIVCFVIYALYQSNLNQGTNVAIVPAAVPPVSVPTPTPTPASNVPAQNSAAPTPVPTPASAPTPAQNTAPQPAAVPTKPKGQYVDGQYTGSVADAYYGYVQVRATISGNKLTNVVFLQYPNDRSNSIYINSQAMPYLISEAIAAQSAHVDFISGASDTSQAFVQSLTAALAQAKS